LWLIGGSEAGVVLEGDVVIRSDEECDECVVEEDEGEAELDEVPISTKSVMRRECVCSCLELWSFLRTTPFESGFDEEGIFFSLECELDRLGEECDDETTNRDFCDEDDIVFVLRLDNGEVFFLLSLSTSITSSSQISRL
jgi:hypothetical protein